MKLATASMVLLLLTFMMTTFAKSSPAVRKRGGLEARHLQTLMNETFVALSCNKQVATAQCKSFKAQFGSGSYKASRVTIPCGECYTMDHDQATLTFARGLDIQGRLIFPERYNLHVLSPLIIVQGELIIRAASKAIDGKEQVIFTLFGEDDTQTFTPIGENANKCMGKPTCEAGKKAFIVAGGKMNVRGIPADTITWGLLYDVARNDTIVLDSANNWATGAEILITSHTREWDQHQVRKIIQVSKLANGKISLRLNQSIIRPTTVLEDARFATEVALLSRNVLIQGGSDQNPYHGGHFVVHHTPGESQWIEGIEFRNMGQQGKLGRYPIHFHFCDDSSKSTIAKNTIRKSNQRCVVVHGTNNLEVRENVAYDTRGHCFMLEDGLEEGNKFIRNLGAQTGIPETIIPEYAHNGKESDHEPATFWITNPTNTFEGNVAAGSVSSGYWFELKLRGERKYLYPDLDPMFSPLGLFKNNVAHSNVGKTGAIRMYTPGYLPEELAVLEGIRSFRNDASGIFIHKNYNLLVQNSLFADNNIGIDVDRAEGIAIENTLIIGESESYRKLMARQTVKPVCAFKVVIGVDVHTWTIFKGHGGSKLKNVEFQGFSNTVCAPRAINMDNHNIEQGQFEHFTSFQNITISSKDNTVSFCDLEGTDIETVYLIDEDGDFAPSGVSPRSASSLISVKPNIQKFVDQSKCLAIAGGCYKYCRDTCFQSIRYEIEGPGTANYELKVCDASDTRRCALFYGSRRDNGNNNGELDPRTFIAHVPTGGRYLATFLTNTGAVYRPTSLQTFFEESLCPNNVPGRASITLL